MLHLLKIEWLKLKNYRTFWILFILYIVAIIGANSIVYRINADLRDNTKEVGKFIPSLYAFPLTWNSTTFVSAFLFLFPGLLIINHCCNEFTYRTSRQNIIDGMKRSDYIMVKLFLTIILSAVATIMVFLTGTFFGYLASGNFNGYTDEMRYIFYYFLQTLVYCILAVFIAHWVRRSGLAIGIYFAYSLIIENVLYGVLWGLVLAKTHNREYSEILPLQSSDALIRTPGVENLVQVTRLPNSVLMTFAIFYALLFSWLTFRRFLVRDL